MGSLYVTVLYTTNISNEKFLVLDHLFIIAVTTVILR